MAIYEHRILTTMPIPESDAATRAVLTAIVIEEVARALDSEIDASVSALSRSLIATVHGHCVFAVSGSFALMGEDQPIDIALARVREILDAHGVWDRKSSDSAQADKYLKFCDYWKRQSTKFDSKLQAV